MWSFPWFKLAWHLSLRGCLPILQKDSVTHMHDLAVYVMEGLHFAWEISLENSADSCLYFRQALLHSVSYFVFLYWKPSLFFYTVFNAFSSNIDEVLFISPSAIVFVSTLLELMNMVNSAIILYLDPWLLLSQSCSFGFVSSNTSIYSIMAFPQLGNSDLLVVPASFDFPSNSKGDALFHCIAND